MKKRQPAGRSAVRLLIALLTTLAVAYVAAVLLPVVVTTFRFSQAMDNEALHGPVNEQAALVRQRLVAQAERLGLPIGREQIVVTKDGPRYTIDADYAVPVRLFGITFAWRFRPHKEGTRRPPAFDRD